MPIKAEIVATGDEIRSGALVDSNSAFISEKMEANGIEVVRHTCVGDDLSTLVPAFREIGKRADVVVVTGGLGPTTDDLSAEAAARAAGVGLALNQNAYENVAGFFRKFNRPMTASNRKQAMLPEGSRVLYNPLGTAPGFSLSIENGLFFFLPGVPNEMKRMLKDSVIPELLAMQGDDTMFSRVKTLTTFGLPESMVGETVAGAESAFPGIKLGLRANFPQIQVKFYGRDSDDRALAERLEAAGRWAAERLGDHVVSDNGEAMETVVGQLLNKRSATLAIAESCTGGLVANWLTNVAGSSDYFLFSGVTYSNRAKIDVLGVNPKTIDEHGAVHEKTALEMAQGASRIVGATYGISTSGIAGPDGGTADKPVGTVCIGLAGPDRSYARRFHFTFGRRLMNKKMFAMAALNLLRKEMLGIGGR